MMYLLHRVGEGCVRHGPLQYLCTSAAYSMPCVGFGRSDVLVTLLLVSASRLRELDKMLVASGFLGWGSLDWISARLRPRRHRSLSFVW